MRVIVHNSACIYREGTAVVKAKYGEGSGTIMMDDVNCTGEESSLFDCDFNGWTNNDCGHGEDAGVKCLQPLISTSDTDTSYHNKSKY